MAKKRMNGSLRLGKVFGIDVELHYTWFFIFTLLAWGLASGFFPQKYPEFSALTNWILGAIASALLFASVLAHELMHSIVALKNKIGVHKITLFFFGGIAHITGEETLTPRKEFTMAIAGPLFSLALGFAFFVLYKYSPFVYLSAICSYLYWINFILAAFNMVPGFPLDGGRVLRAALWAYYKDIRKATRYAAFGGKAFAVMMIVFGFAGFFFGFGGIWFIVLGFFLYMIAQSSYEQTVVRDVLAGIRVADVMRKDFVAVKGSTTAAELFSNYFLKYRQESFPVIEKNKMIGIVSIANMKGLSKQQWLKKQVSSIMTRNIKFVKPEQSAFSALAWMLEHNIDILPVMKDGKVLGIVYRDAIIHLIRVKSAVGE